jgi:hypothetical protein
MLRAGKPFQKIKLGIRADPERRPAIEHNKGCI